MKPELLVRKLVHALGFRFRLHRKDLPGKPDLAFIGRKRAVFVHGCYWHQHQGCREGRLPSSNIEYWQPKLQRNTARDAQNIRDLESFGWQVMVVWECETKSLASLSDRLAAFLEG